MLQQGKFRPEGQKEMLLPAPLLVVAANLRLDGLIADDDLLSLGEAPYPVPPGR